MKLVSEWLLLSAKYKLKNFTSARAFLREDLPLEVRVARAKQRKEELQRKSSVSESSNQSNP